MEVGKMLYEMGIGKEAFCGKAFERGQYIMSCRVPEPRSHDSIQGPNMDDDRDFNQKPSSPVDVEDDSGLELSLGLSCGTFISKTKSRDGINELNADQGKNDRMKNGNTDVVDASLKHFLQEGIGKKEDIMKEQDDSMHHPQENFWTNLEKNPSREPVKSLGMCMEHVQFPGFVEAWHSAETFDYPKASVQQIESNFTEKTGLTENSGTAENKGDDSNMTKDIQLVPHVAAGAAASWGHLSQQNLPSHFIETFRNGSVMSGRATPPSHANSNSAVQLVEPDLSSMRFKSSEHLGITPEKQSIDIQNSNRDQQQMQPAVPKHQQDDILDQQKKRETSAQKWQEARKKRKLLIEEHKQQKKAKKEDERTGPHGFRRPGSNSWVRGWEGPTPTMVDMERSTSMLDVGSDDSQVLEINHHLQGERNMKENAPETQKEESSESQQEGSIASDHSFLHRMKAQEIRKCPSNAKEVRCPPNENGEDWTKYQSETCQQKAVEMQLNQPGVQQLTKDGAEGIQDNHLVMSSDSHCKQLTEIELVDSPSSRRMGRGKGSMKQCTSTGTNASEQAEGAEEQDIAKSNSKGAETSVVPCTTVGNKSNTAAVSSVTSAIPAAMTSTPLPYSLPHFSVVPSPYALPLPVPNSPSIPFPVGFSFPYVMQYVPTTVDSVNHSAARPPMYPSGFQLPLGYAPFQLPTLETGSSWLPVLHPHQSHVICPPSVGGTGTSSEPVEDEIRVSEGIKCCDQRKSPRSSSVDDTSDHTIHPLCRADSLGHSQEHGAALMHLHPLVDTQVLSTIPGPPGPPCGLSRTLSGTGEMQLLMGHGRVPPLPGFASVVHASEAPPGYFRATTGSASKESRKQDSTNSLLKDETQIRRSNDLDNSDASQTALTSQTLDHDTEGQGIVWPSMANCVSQEVWNLRPGLAAGLKFGGTGSTPDLPWVSTTGPGPNGRTISGALYRYSRSQVRIVCACHGRHMSPSEFVQHAGIVEASNPEKNIVVNPNAFGSQAASAQV